jgi:hypothetical protein
MDPRQVTDEDESGSEEYHQDDIEEYHQDDIDWSVGRCSECARRGQLDRICRNCGTPETYTHFQGVCQGCNTIGPIARYCLTCEGQCQSHQPYQPQFLDVNQEEEETDDDSEFDFYQSQFHVEDEEEVEN